MNIEEIQTKMEETTASILDFYSPYNDPQEMKQARSHLEYAYHDLLGLAREVRNRIDSLENPSEYDAVVVRELGSRRATMKYLIFSIGETGLNDGEPMFWQHDQGWVSIHDATHYELADIHMVSPMGKSDTYWMTQELAQKITRFYYWAKD